MLMIPADTDTTPENQGGWLMKEYTICVAFAISFFSDKATLFSYALNDSYNNMLVLAMTPERFYVTYGQVTTKVPVHNLYDLDKWRRACLVGVKGHSHTFYLDGRVLKSWPWNQEPPLPPGGALVLGQDQDSLLGGYSIAQSFNGRLTDVNAWNRALSSREILRQGQCREQEKGKKEEEQVEKGKKEKEEEEKGKKEEVEEAEISGGDWISWEKASWKPEGAFVIRSESPCQETKNKIVFFNAKLPRHEAFHVLKIMKITPVLPKDQEEADNLQKLMMKYGTKCDHEAVSNRTVWINALYAPEAMKWQNGDTGDTLHFSLERRQRTYESKTGSLQVSDNTWITDDAENANCFAGLMPQVVQVFRLTGFTEMRSYYREQLAFVLSQSENEHGFFFKGIRNFSIDYTQNTWQLIHPRTNSPLATHSSEKLPIGRLPWIVHGQTKNLSLSICSSTEFMCDDGSCINMTRRCDLVSDCADWSDERQCELVDLPPGYINTLPPAQNLQLKIVVHLEVITVDLLEMSLLLNLKMDLFWCDPNVRYRNLRPSLLTNQIHGSGGHYPLWIPDIEVEPLRGFPAMYKTLMVSREANGATEGDNTLYEGRENPLRLQVRFQPRIRCNFNLQLFPWDVQTCLFYLTVTNIEHTNVNLNGSSVGTYTKHLHLEEYSLTNLTLAEDKTIGSMVITIALERHSGQYLWDSYLPTFLLLAIGYSTLFLPVVPFNDRGTMSLTSLLVLVALFTDSLASLPGTSYNTHIDTWYIFSMAYLGLIIATHIISPNGGVLRRSRLFFALAFGVFLFFYIFTILTY